LYKFSQSCKIPKSIGNCKSNPDGIFTLNPDGPAQPPSHRPTHSTGHRLLSRLARPVCHWCILMKTFSFHVCVFHLGALSLPTHRHPGPTCQAILFLCAQHEPAMPSPLHVGSGRPKLRTLRCCLSPFTHHLDSPLKSYLKPSRPSMVSITFKLTIAA
jgi:hypothetical protein